MGRYFRITEIDDAAFTRATGEYLDCSQLSVPVDGDVYVAVDEEDESEISVGLECIDSAG